MNLTCSWKFGKKDLVRLGKESDACFHKKPLGQTGFYLNVRWFAQQHGQLNSASPTSTLPTTLRFWRATTYKPNYNWTHSRSMHRRWVGNKQRQNRADASKSTSQRLQIPWFIHELIRERRQQQNHTFHATAVKLMNNLVNAHKDSTKMEFKRFLEKEKTNILDQNKFIIFGKFLQWTNFVPLTVSLKIFSLSPFSRLRFFINPFLFL